MMCEQLTLEICQEQTFGVSGSLAKISASQASKQDWKPERSGLFFEIMRLLAGTQEENRPEWLLAENVKNLLSVGNGFDFLRLLIEMDAVGYDIEWQVLNAKDFGVPQNRETDNICQTKQRQWVRLGMQRKEMDIGTAYQPRAGTRRAKWTYNIVVGKLAQYLALPVETVIQQVEALGG